MSPDGSGRRGQANQFRQAKGPDKEGTGFKVSRASGASATPTSDTKTPPFPLGPPSMQPSSALVRATSGDGHSGVRDNLRTVDDATHSRVIQGQEQALADANARHASSMSASAKVTKSCWRREMVISGDF